MHGGGVVGDFNNDGYPDLFVIGGGDTTDRLFINDQDGTFSQNAAAWGLTDLYRGTGAAAVDYDDDGWTDIFVTSMGDMSDDPKGGGNKLYRNNGNGTFSNVALAAGVAYNSTGTDAAFDGYSATFGDYDLDGCLDLWMGGWHSNANPHITNQTSLFRNNCDGTFSDVTVSAGVFDIAVRGFGAIFADMNGDRYPELLVAGDFGTSNYFVNNRDGTFTKNAIWGSNKIHNGMGTTLGDFNRDGLPDWFITAIDPAYLQQGPNGNRIYMNQGNHNFQELPGAAGTNPSGTRDGGWGWGAAAVDFDHDGWVDIAHTNGWTVTLSVDPDGLDPITGEQFYDDHTRVFHNNGDATFTEVALDWGLEHRLQGRGLYQFDYDLDGDMDIVITSNTIEYEGTEYAHLQAAAGDLMLMRNDVVDGATPADASWLKVNLDTSGFDNLAPHGLGAIVRARVGDENGNPRHVTMNAGSNFLGHGELLAHFGLGSAADVDQVLVEWTNGFATVVSNVAVNQQITVSPVQPFDHGPLVRGQTVELTINGLRANETAYVLAGVAGTTDSGNCYAALGGLCTDILNPKLIAVGTADAAGNISKTIAVPAVGAGATTMSSQALIRRGNAGTASLKTNVVIRPIIELDPE